MARMIPSAFFSGIRSPGEEEIFRRLKDDPITENWVVLHSLDVVNHRNQVAGEIDFVIIVPSKGVICLEVKAVRSVRREEGLWYLGTNPTPEVRGPFKQASEAMHSLRKYAIKRYPNLIKVLFWSAVIFPFTEFDEQSAEWHPWQLIDARHYRSRSMGQIILGVLNQARNFVSTIPTAGWFDSQSKEPTSSQCKDLISCLRANFEFLNRQR